MDLKPLKSMLNLKQSTAEIQDKVKEMMENLDYHIMCLPDNPNIKRNGNSFTMSISKLMNGGILAPCHYDFKYQYKCVVVELSKCHAENVYSKLEKIISEKYIKATDGSKLRLHDDVISHLKTLL